MAKGIAQFTITGAGDEYVLQIEDEDGESWEFTASYEQLDLIVESVDQCLNLDEEDALEIDEDEED